MFKQLVQNSINITPEKLAIIIRKISSNYWKVEVPEVVL